MKRLLLLITAALVIISLVLTPVVADNGASGKYKDVKDSDWFAEAVGKLSALDIVNGMADGSFSPQGQVTRAQFVKMLVQAMEYKKIDSLSFEDLKSFQSSKPHWASVYVETALRNGVIVKEEIGENFYPDVPLTRMDMGIMMFRALKLEQSAGENPFGDLDEANGYFTKLYEEYLIRGTVTGGKVLFQPEGLTTRAQAAVIISRMLEYKEDPAAYVAKTARAERFANGTQTAEDIAAKRAEEIAKAQADPNYIMEPQIRILNTLEDFAGYGKDVDFTFNLNAAYISLDNGEDYVKYASDTQMKIVCTDKDKDLLNTKTPLTEPFISYDHRYEVRIDVYNQITYGYNEKAKGNIVFYIKRNEEKSVKGKWMGVPDYVKKGETVHLKFYFRRGSNTQEYNVNVPIN